MIGSSTWLLHLKLTLSCPISHLHSILIIQLHSMPIWGHVQLHRVQLFVLSSRHSEVTHDCCIYKCRSNQLRAFQPDNANSKIRSRVLFQRVCESYWIRIKMAEFGCTQIRTSNSCTLKRKKIWQSVFWVWNILPRGLIGLLNKMAKKSVWPFCWPPWGRFWPKMGIIGGDLWVKLAQMFP